MADRPEHRCFPHHGGRLHQSLSDATLALLGDWARRDRLRVYNDESSARDAGQGELEL